MLRKNRQSEYFGRPLPELSSEDITPKTAEVTFNQTPGGGSLPWTSVITGANNSEFPLAAWYKSKAGNIGAKSKSVNDFYKNYGEPEGYATHQPIIDKYWNNQVMGYFDSDMLGRYGQDAYRIAEGDVRNQTEAKAYRTWQQRVQAADNMAQTSKLVGGLNIYMEDAEKEGKYIPQTFKDKLYAFNHAAEHFGNVDSDEDIKMMNDVYASQKVLPSYIDWINKFGDSIQTSVEDAYKTSGGKIPNILEITKMTSLSSPQMNTMAEMGFDNGYRASGDNTPQTGYTPEQKANAIEAIKQEAVAVHGKKIEQSLHNTPQGRKDVYVHADKPTFFESSANEASTAIGKLPAKEDAITNLSALNPEHFLPQTKDEQSAISLPLNINPENLAKGEINADYFKEKVIPRTLVYNDKGELKPFMSEKELYKIQQDKNYKVSFSSATPSLVFGDKSDIGDDGQPHKLLRRKITGEQMKTGYKPFFDIQYTMVYTDNKGATKQKTLHHYVDATKKEAPKQLDAFYFGLGNAKTLETAASAGDNSEE